MCINFRQNEKTNFATFYVLIQQHFVEMLDIVFSQRRSCIQSCTKCSCISLVLMVHSAALHHLFLWYKVQLYITCSYGTLCSFPSLVLMVYCAAVYLLSLWYIVQLSITYSYGTLCSCTYFVLIVQSVAVHHLFLRYIVQLYITCSYGT